MRTNQIQTTPEQFQEYRRLGAAGCLIDGNSLAEPCVPLRVRQESSALGTELLPIAGATAIVCRLNILASVRFRLTEVGLQANCLPSSWERPEVLRSRGYGCCFHNCLGGDVRLAPGSMLTYLYQRTLKRGEEFNGYFACILGGVVPPSAGRKLQATLVLRDELHRSYPYSLLLDNRQRISGGSDEYCQFRSASQIEAEIQRQEEAERIAEQRDLALATPPPPKESSLAAIVDRVMAEPLPRRW